jgi:hypothetical protein
MPVPLPVLPGVYYARIEGLVEGFPSSNVFTFQQTPAAATGPADVTVAGQVAFSIAANWQASMLPVLSSLYNMEQVSCYALNTPLAPKVVFADATAGAVTGAITSLSTAVAISHTVSRRGRGSQSRTFLTPVVASQMAADGRELIDTDQAAISTAFGHFITNTLAELVTSAGPSWEYVQLSKGKLPAPVGATFQITGSACERLLSTQRRRVRRSGG